MKTIINIIKYFTWLHEIFHLLPAWMLNVPIQASHDHVIFDLADQEWKNIIIVLCPFVALGAVFGLVFFFTTNGLDKGWLWPAGFLWASCVWDVVDIVNFIKTKDWKNGK